MRRGLLVIAMLIGAWIVVRFVALFVIWPVDSRPIEPPPADVVQH